MNKFILIVALLFGATISQAQTHFHISVLDKSYLPEYTDGSYHFSQSNLNSLVSQYNLNYFKQAFPDAKIEALRQVYEIGCNNIELANAFQEL